MTPLPARECRWIKNSRALVFVIVDRIETPPFLFIWGVLLLEEKKFPPAVEHLREAVRLTPADPRAHFYLAEGSRTWETIRLQSPNCN